ncbi:MAG: NACHT domain-containing protein [Microcoleaceae cyanobacterium]
MTRPKKFKKVGEAFKKLFLSKGFKSAYELSKESRLDKTYISKVVNGYVGNPSYEKIKQIAEAFAKKSELSVDDEIAELTKLFANDANSFNQEEEERSLSENTPKNEGKLVEKTSSPESNFSEINNSENHIYALVKNIKNKRYERIKSQCGKLQTLYTREIEITKIYTDVNILENPTNERWLEIPDLLKNFKPEEVNSEKFDRLGLSKANRRKSGLEVLKVVETSQNLMVLGKPGSGKTTFLKWLGIKCNDNEDNFLADRLPIFITLQQLSDDKNLDNENFDFLDYIFTEEFSEICEKKELEKILSCGKAFILLDGLDEVVPAKKAKQLTQYIQDFAKSSRYYQNKFIISCRIAAQEYRFQGFTYIEVADFNEIQVKNFVENWFVAVDSNSPENGREKSKQFLEKIQLPENRQIRELAVTPILLNLACVVFQDRLDFPSKRYKLYEEGLDILLGKWDKNRGIKRDEVYKNLSVLHKKELLTKLAAATFETGDYFFESEKVEKLIAEYLQSLSGSNQDKIQLQLDSEAVLNSLEAQHGLLIERANKIYSFSHQTFHEYFTAKFFIDNSYSEKLLDSWANKRYREVFLLTVQSLENADNFLLNIKNKIDKMAARDKLFQESLKWISGKVSFVDHRNQYKLAAIRAMYLDSFPRYNTLYQKPLVRERNATLAFAIDAKVDFLDQDIKYLFLASSLFCIIGYYIEVYYYHKKECDEHYIVPDLKNICGFILKDLECDFVFDKRLQNFILIAEKGMPNLNNLWDKEKGDSSSKDILEWWNLVAEPQIKELLFNIVQYNFERPDLKFGSQQFKLDDKYYYANELLIDCLNTNSNVSPEVREEIEETLLLPLEEIEKWKQQHRPNNS